jgi:putative inorganic carbon (HCO3(-)) transporter
MRQSTHWRSLPSGTDRLPTGGSFDAGPVHRSMIPRARLPMRTDLALLALVAAGPLESAVQLSGGTVLTLTKVLGGLCFLLFALDWTATRRPLVFDATHAMLLVLLAIGLVSTVGARAEAQAFSTVLRLGSFVGLYIVVTQFVGDHRLLRRIAWVLSVASAIAAGLAIHNFTTGITLLAKPTYGDANDMAYALATTLPFTLWLLGRGRLAMRALALALAVVIFAGVILSFSRGALLALAVAAVWLVITERKRLSAAILVAAIVGLSVVVIAGFLRSDRSALRQGLTAKERVATANIESRLSSWRGALVMAQGHPLLGVGPGNFQDYYFIATGHPPGSISYVAHDAYLEIAAELGLIALVILLAFIGIAFHRLGRSIRWRAGPPGFAVVTRAALVVAVVGALTLSEEYYPPIWMIAGLATLLWHETKATVDARVAA